MADEAENIVTSEELEENLEGLLALVDARAQAIKDAQDKRVLERRRSSVVRTTTPRKPDVSDRFRSALRRALEDELFVAPETLGGAEIETSEFERELLKRALVKLKVSDLRKVAAQTGVDWHGYEEELADRIVRALDFDEARVAQLILEYDEERRPERGLIERIYRVDAATDELHSAARTLESLVNRYVRVGIARWFIFQAVHVTADDIQIRGMFRGYRAEAVERDAQYEITPLELRAPVSVVLDPQSGEARVRARGVLESTAAMTAIEAATGVGRATTVSFGFQAPDGLLDWDPRTLYMLDLAAHGLQDPPLSVANLTMAHFEAEDQGEVAELTPQIRSVRLEGDHVADSVAACQLLVARRTLVGVSMLLRFAPAGDGLHHFPVRVAIGRDHVSVLTGYGADAQMAAAAHRVVRDRVQGSVDRLTDPVGLGRLVDRIRTRAARSQPVEKADLFVQVEPVQDRRADFFVQIDPVEDSRPDNV